MDRDCLVDALGAWFGVEELVCPHVYGRFGESSWQFLDRGLLEVLLLLRRGILGVPMYCNMKSSGLTQRGLRCNMCSLVKGKSRAYLSAHVLGKGLDFTLGGGMSASEARGLIKESAALFPCRVRVEGGVSWLHVDVIEQWGVESKVYEFRV